MSKELTEQRTVLFSDAEGDSFGELDGVLYKPPVGATFKWKPFNMEPTRYRVVSVEEDLMVALKGATKAADYIKVVVHCVPADEEALPK